MPADQAAGLRRRSALQPLRCIHCFFDSPRSTVRLAQTLHQHGWTSLLVDTAGRVFANSPTCSLLDWRQQLGRQQLHTLSMPYGDGWYAPGIRADEPALQGVAQDYDCLLFDVALSAPEAGPLPGVARILILEVNATHESKRHCYALLKTLSIQESRISVALLGDPAACDQLQAACRQFLDRAFIQDVCNMAHQDDAFAALAVRMVREETSLTACQ